MRQREMIEYLYDLLMCRVAKQMLMADAVGDRVNTRLLDWLSKDIFCW
jgi:hypothetical protein